MRRHAAGPVALTAALATGAGRTWRNMGLAGSGHIPKILAEKSGRGLRCRDGQLLETEPGPQRVPHQRRRPRLALRPADVDPAFAIRHG
jgi:hypothetical protein